MRRILALPLALGIGCAPAVKGSVGPGTVSGLPESPTECKSDDLAELITAPVCDYLSITLRNSRGDIYFQMRQNGGCRELYYDSDADGKLDSYWAENRYSDVHERFYMLMECPQAGK